ncbi:jg1803 [Pararge aegeria aegeria]|uniref:Jg1803 protein n=1 Tax=Pararge aegeria aegeria TaxID=348720 RepID=A0A8S4RTY8_9NEOP|nr:jg1803 [Pararge aegeria aegeria]
MSRQAEVTMGGAHSSMANSSRAHSTLTSIHVDIPTELIWRPRIKTQPTLVGSQSGEQTTRGAAGNKWPRIVDFETA